MKKQIIIGILFSILLFSSCGTPTISVDESTYEPKIVINGFLIPGNPVSKIKIDRNFPLGQTIDKNDIPLSDGRLPMAMATAWMLRRRWMDGNCRQLR